MSMTSPEMLVMVLVNFKVAMLSGAVPDGGFGLDLLDGRAAAVFVTLAGIGLSLLSATSAGIVASSEVIFAFIVAWLWLGESLSFIQILGALIVTAGIILAQTSRGGKVVDLDLAATTGAIPIRKM